MKRVVALAICFLAFLAVASASGPTVPKIFARRDYTGLNAYWVQVADTNGDGIPDLIASVMGYMQVLFGNGDGTFGPAGADTHTAGGFQFVAVDMNGDGIIDVVQSSGVETQGGVEVSLGNGDGTFQTGIIYTVPDTTGWTVVGDFNGDGIPDVAMPGSKGIWLFTGRGGGILNPGVLAAPLPSCCGADIAADDFNGDGKLDLVVIGGTSSGQGFVVLFGNGDGTFQAPQEFTEPLNNGAIAVGSLAKGGPPSIAVCCTTTNGNVILYYGNGAGGFSAPSYVNLPGISDRGGLALGDLNGDGIPDLVSSQAYVAYGIAGGGFQSPISYPIVEQDSNYFNVVLADLRKNGRLDIVTDDNFGNSVLLNTGLPKDNYEEGIWTPVSGGAQCGVAADFNGDGKPDLAVNTSSGISILLGTGVPDAPFKAGATITVANIGCAVTGDLNGDGIPDLLVPVNGSPNELWTYLGNGNGTYRLTSKTQTPNHGGYVVLADFNHDGKLDFATSGNLVALGNGDGTFQKPAPIVSNPPSSGFSNIAAGDINNDGWPDIVLTNSEYASGINLYVLLNNQQGGFTQAPTTFGQDTVQAILADLNGDGNLDLVLLGSQTTGASIFLGDGTGAFTAGPVLGGVFGAIGFFNMVADLNGDGIPDIEVMGGDTFLVYLGMGNATYATPFGVGTGADPGNLLVENLHGQSPSAGVPDIVAPDANGGVVVLINATKPNGAVQ